MDFSHLYLSTEGRIGRQSFWIGHIILAVIGIVITFIAAGLFGQLSFASQLINFIYIVVIAYPAYAVSAKRFQDRGKNGLLGAILIGLSVFSSLVSLFGLTGDPADPNAFGIILGLVTLGVVIWYLIDLGIMKGTEGSNEYGPDPLA